MKAVASADTIPPGGEGEILVTFISDDHKGHIEKNVTIETNDPVRPKIRLKLKANVTVELEFVPKGIIFRNLHRFETYRKNICIFGQKAKNINITGIETSDKKIHAIIASPEETSKFCDGGKSIILWILPGFPPGKLFGKIVIHTDDPLFPVNTIKIYGEIIGNIDIVPERIDFGFFDKGEIPVRTVKLSMAKPEDKFSILRVEDPTGKLDIDIKSIKDGKVYQLSISPKKIIDRGMISGKLKIITDYPGEETIYIPIFGGIRFWKK